MSRRQEENKIASDLELCDLMLAIGDKKAKRAARRHRKICMAQIRAWNKEDGLDAMSDDEILLELLAT